MTTIAAIDGLWMGKHPNMIITFEEEGDGSVNAYQGQILNLSVSVFLLSGQMSMQSPQLWQRILSPSVCGSSPIGQTVIHLLQFEHSLTCFFILSPFLNLKRDKSVPDGHRYLHQNLSIRKNSIKSKSITNTISKVRYPNLTSIRACDEIIP